MLVPLYTRVFKPEEFGVIALITPLVTLLTIASVLGLDNSSARWFYDSDDPADRKRTIASWFWCQLAVSVALATPLFLAAPQAAQILLGDSAHASLLRLVAVTIPLATFLKVCGNYLRYQRHAVAAAALSAVSAIGLLLLTALLVAVLGWGLPGVYWAVLIAAVITGVTSVLLMREWLAWSNVSLDRLRPMLRFGVPMVPAGIAIWVTLSSDRFILTLYHGQGEVGIYAVGTAIAAVATLGTAAFQMAWGPFAFSIAGEDDAPAVYARVLDLYFFAGCALCLAISLFAPELIQVVAPPEYAKATACVPWLTYGVLFAGATYIASLGSGLAKKSGPIALSVVLGAALNIVLNFLMIPSMGMVGAAIATAAAHLFGCLCLFRFSQRLHPIPYRLLPALACCGVSISLIVVFALWPPEHPVWTYVSRGFALILFVAACPLMGVCTWSEIRLKVRSILGS